MPSEKGMVHVIDDDEALRESLAFLLRTARIEVANVSNRHAAFLDALPETRKLSCVITDVRMPGMSGIDLLRRLRELKIDVPVIVITGHGDVPVAVEAMKIGAIDFLEKPFDDEVLLASVRAALIARTATASVMPSGPKSKASSRPFPTASATCSAASSLAGPTSRSPTTSASARARSRFTVPIL